MTNPTPTTERFAQEEATVLDEGLDAMTLLQATGLNTGELNPALGRLIDSGKVVDWWADATPRVRMYRKAGQ